MDPMDALREQLLGLLDGRDARFPFDQVVADFPDDAVDRDPPNVIATPWQLLEHIRLTQTDIVSYIEDRDYVEPPWPAGYWPAPEVRGTPAAFAATVSAIRTDLDRLRALVADPATDLLATIPGTPGHTILREVRIVADHNAFHLGEFAILRQVMGTWPPNRRG
jgi:hypothetical protein